MQSSLPQRQQMNLYFDKQHLNHQQPTEQPIMNIKLTAVVQSVDPDSQIYTLTAMLHRSDSAGDRILTEEALYQHARPDLHPNGTHYEMELDDGTVIILDIPKPSIIHAIKAEDGRYFVCYPNKVETEAEAQRIFRIWALGSVASLRAECDKLIPNFDVDKTSATDFARVMEDDYGLILKALYEFRT
jgi:hypothetical protein